MAVPNAARGSTGGVDEQSMAVPNAARASTGGVDEQSMAVPNAARGSTGGVDEQSIAVPSAARGSTGGVDGQSMLVLTLYVRMVGSECKMNRGQGSAESRVLESGPHRAVRHVLLGEADFGHENTRDPWCHLGGGKPWMISFVIINKCLNMFE